MGARYSDAYNINKEDVGKSVILKHRKGLAEWWVYRQRASRFVDLTGKKMKVGESYLYCVISCEDKADGIRQENEKFIAIEGVKFTDDVLGQDLTDYIRKMDK